MGLLERPVSGQEPFTKEGNAVFVNVSMFGSGTEGEDLRPLRLGDDWIVAADDDKVIFLLSGENSEFGLGVIVDSFVAVEVV